MIDHSFNIKILEYSLPYDKNFFKYIKEYPLKSFEHNNNSYFNEKEDSELNEKVNGYIKSIADQNNCVLVKTWIQQYNEGQFHDIHTHGNGEFYSFIWYLDCTEKSSFTVFYNQGYPYILTHKFFSKPEKNKFILFDGTLPHFVLPNKDNTRLIISGNLKKI
jgi:hypothetical protein